MGASTLRIAPTRDGWQLLDDGRELLWLLERAQAVAAATQIALERAQQRSIPTTVEEQTPSGNVVVLARYPRA